MTIGDVAFNYLMTTQVRSYVRDK